MRKMTLIAAVMALVASSLLTACTEMRQGARTGGTYVGEAAAIPDELNRGINEGYRDDPGPNPYNR